MEGLEEYTLDSFESIAEPTSQAVMVCVTGYDRDDLEGHLPWASRLEHAELVEMARRRRREILGADYPKKPVKDGWLGPVPPEARDNELTLLYNARWWFFPCKRGSLPPFRYDGAIDAWRKTVLAFSNDRIYLIQRDDPMSTPIPRLTDYEDVEIMKATGTPLIPGTEDPRHPRARVDAESATVNVHSCFWHVNARETLRSARCIQSPHLHQALKNPKLGIQRV